MPSLASLGGARAPEELVEELRLLLPLDERAADGLWLLLTSAVAEAPDEGLSAQVEAFATRHGIEPRALGRSLLAHRFVLREAARRAVEPSDYATDLRRLCPEEAEADRLQTLLLPAFAPAMRVLEGERVWGAIADHGKLLTGVRWRVDMMVASDRGSAEAKRVGMLTLQIREAGKSEQLTVQVLPDALEALAEACQAMVNA